MAQVYMELGKVNDVRERMAKNAIYEREKKKSFAPGPDTSVHSNDPWDREKMIVTLGPGGRKRHPPTDKRT